MGTMGPRNIWALLVLALTATLFGEAKAQGLTTYLESSGTEHKPRSNLGVSLHGDRVRLRADVALRGIARPTDHVHRLPSGSTEVVPNLRSAFTVAKNLDLETRVSFAEWNAGTAATLDTRLRYRKSLNAFVDELDGSIWRSPEGFTRKMLRLGFHQPLGDDDGATAPLTITGAAMFEATQHDSAPADLSGSSRRVGVETRVTGLMPRFAMADQSVTFKVERTAGMRSESTRTLAYDRSWTLSSLTNLGFSLKYLRRTDRLADRREPSIAFSWRGRL
jgi:hypothetical protein